MADIAYDEIIKQGVSQKLSAMESRIDDYRGSIDALQAVAPTSGAPVTAQSPASGSTGTGNTEILWTANTSGYNGKAGNGIKIDVVFDPKVTGTEVSVVDTDIRVSVEATGEPLKTAVTCIDVINAVAEYPESAALLSGALQGGGGTVQEGTVGLKGGVDITAAPAGSIRFNDGTLWVSTDDSLVDDSYWKKVPLSEPTPLVLDVTDATGGYLLSQYNQTVVIKAYENEQGDPEHILLPAATGSGIEIRIANKHASYEFEIAADGADTIDADTTISLAPYTSCILVDIEEGMWAQF